MSYKINRHNAFERERTRQDIIKFFNISKSYGIFNTYEYPMPNNIDPINNIMMNINTFFLSSPKNL